MSLIEVTTLTKYNGKTRGIVNVSFSEEEGEIFGFIEPTALENLPPHAAAVTNPSNQRQRQSFLQGLGIEKGQASGLRATCGC